MMISKLLEQIKKNWVTFLSLLIIIFVGAFLRFNNLNQSPPSLNWDQAALGYNAYSILKTGADEYGRILPIFTRSFDDYKSAIPVYLIIPSIFLFGLTQFAVALPSVFFGTLSILLIYLLAKETLRDERVALISSFIFAIEPWSVHLSRVNYESNEALFFFLLGFYLFLKSKVKNVFLPASLAFFMLSMYTYHSNKVLVPLFIIGLYFLNKNLIRKYSEISKKVSLVVFIIFIIPYVYLAFKGEVFARVGATNIFVLWENLPQPKIYYFTWEIIGRYLGYFSAPNLFIREPQEPVTILAGNSIFYLMEFIPWIFGLWYIVKHHRNYKELLFLILISPIPAIVTWNWFQPGRVMSLFASFSILIGIGIVKIINTLPAHIKKLSYLGFFAFSALNIFYLFDSVNVYLPYRDLGNFQPGFKETVPAVLALSDKYDQVIIDTPQAQPYIFYLFYGAYDPSKYRKELDLSYIGTPRKHFDFGKFKFRKIIWEEDKNLPNTLFVANDFPQDAKVIHEAKDRYGNTVNKIVQSN